MSEKGSGCGLDGASVERDASIGHRHMEGQVSPANGLMIIDFEDVKFVTFWYATILDERDHRNMCVSFPRY